MRLAKRLSVLAEYVPPGSIVADIGTDHAYLPVCLINDGICRRAIATDIKPGPLKYAARTTAAYHLADRIELRLGDGLRPLMPGEADVLVLAGMGGKTIIDILAAAPNVLHRIHRIIMQPMSGAGSLRLWLAANNWRIKNEKLLLENGRMYQIIVAVPGRELFADQLLLFLGPRLIEEKDPLLAVYLKQIMERCRSALIGLNAGNGLKNEVKINEFKNMLVTVEELLKCL